MSTYSPSLRIELIGTGDQAGTWGNTTNTNLGTLIESAVAGYVSVSVTSANQAFTALNGAADQARNQSIALTTTTGANFAVYAPPAEKTYVIYNASVYTATIYNSTVIGNTTAAGTGVDIPAGKTMTVWTEGTNFRLQNTQLEGTSTTQSFGTNTTQLATTAFVQAALQALHPVGSIYINATSATNPATLFGFGTWVAFGAGRVPVGVGGSFTAGATGGSADATLVTHSHTFSGTTSGQSNTHSHSISVSDPGHNHVVLPDIGGAFVGDGNYVHPAQVPNYASSAVTRSNTTGITVSAGNASADHSHTYSGTTSTSGSSATNANLQPYIVVYMWQRTA